MREQSGDMDRSPLPHGKAAARSDDSRTFFVTRSMPLTQTFLETAHGSHHPAPLPSSLESQVRASGYAVSKEVGLAEQKLGTKWPCQRIDFDRNQPRIEIAVDLVACSHHVADVDETVAHVQTKSRRDMKTKCCTEFGNQTKLISFIGSDIASLSEQSAWESCRHAASVSTVEPSMITF